MNKKNRLLVRGLKTLFAATPHSLSSEKEKQNMNLINR